MGSNLNKDKGSLSSTTHEFRSPALDYYLQTKKDFEKALEDLRELLLNKNKNLLSNREL